MFVYLFFYCDLHAEDTVSNMIKQAKVSQFQTWAMTMILQMRSNSSNI